MLTSNIEQNTLVRCRFVLALNHWHTLIKTNSSLGCIPSLKNASTNWHREQIIRRWARRCDALGTELAELIAGYSLSYSVDSQRARMGAQDLIAYTPRQELPKGSSTFQQVMDEIRREKEREQNLINKTLSAFAVANNKDLSTTPSKNAKGSRWRMASFKLLARKPSQKDLIKGQPWRSAEHLECWIVDKCLLQ